MKELIIFLLGNREWLFSGIAIVIVAILINLISIAVQKIEQEKSQNLVLWIKMNGGWLFSGIGVISIAISIGLASNVYVDKISKSNKETLEHKSFVDQIQSLNNIEKSLDDLIVFVNSQKDKLKDSERVLISLKKEHETLKPIVESEREVIKNIFALQSQITTDKIWKERIISFFLGILASVIASFVYGLFQRFYKTT